MVIWNVNNLSKKWTQLAKYNNENICNVNTQRFPVAETLKMQIKRLSKAAFFV